MNKSLTESMKTITAIILFALALVPAAPAAQATDLTGDWNAKFTAPRPDGTTQSITFTFHFTQKGKVLSGTVGPSAAAAVEESRKALVDGAKVTFVVTQPEGPTLRSFTLTHAKGRLTGTMKAERGGDTLEAAVTPNAPRPSKGIGPFALLPCLGPRASDSRHAKVTTPSPTIPRFG